MVIDDIHAHYLRVPLVKPYELALGTVTHYDLIVVAVRDRHGAVGLGEACVLPGYTDETVEGCWTLVRELAARGPGSSFTAAKAAFLKHVADAPFAVTALVSALEHAEASPLLQVDHRETVPILGIVGAHGAAELDREIEGLLAQGYRTLKVKVGFDVQADLARLEIIQNIVRGRCLLRLDGNQGYSREQALQFVKAMRTDAIELLEQPCAAGDWEAARDLARVARVPMMLDESIYDNASIERAAQLEAASYIKLKLMKAGGIERLDAMLARIAELGMKPVLGNGVASDLSCWMEACVLRRHGGRAGEMNGFLKPVIPLLKQPLEMRDGGIVLEPGFRPELSAQALTRYGVADQRFTRRTVLRVEGGDVNLQDGVRQRTIVTGVIGSDTHIVGNRILSMALENAGYKLVSLGALTPSEDFIKAAIETAADAILVSSLYGQGEIDCRGFRDLCVEAGIGDMLLYVGGNLVVGKQPWQDVEKRFLSMGFDRAFPPGTRTEEVTAALETDFAAREQGLRIAPS